jgi:hypothetical protein
MIAVDSELGGFRFIVKCNGFSASKLSLKYSECS